MSAIEGQCGDARLGQRKAEWRPLGQLSWL